jgi:Zn-dependent protease
MNVLLAIGLVGLAKIGAVAGQSSAIVVFLTMAHLSLLLCFFNLLPIPPLDGSHVMRVLINMDYLTYLQIAQYGFIIIILILNFVPYVGRKIGMASFGTLDLLIRLFGMG